jgi:PAS domain S-box-containing protein
MQVESYCGIPIFGRDQTSLGLLVVMDDKAMEAPDDRLRALLTIFAARAGMELERLQVDESLRKSEEKFAKAFQSSPVIFALANEEMRYIAVNETFTLSTGYSAEEAIGRTPAELGFLQHPERLPQFIERLFAVGRIRQHEFGIRDKQGKNRVGLISAEVIEISGERCILTITEDITERKNAESILRRSRDELEALVLQRTEQLQVKNKELEAFSYSASHDLQSPLRAILGFSRALNEDYSDKMDNDGKEFLRRIVNAAERMTRLIDDLLEYSRIGRKTVDLQPIQLRALARDIAADYSLRLDEIQGTIELTDLPNVLGDKTLLSQVFINLFQNAINYRDLQRQLNISVSATTENNDVIIAVRDNGIGIAPENYERIFLPFQRSSGGERCQGTGLGLANVKRSVQAMGGTVWVESQPGKGSTFKIRLRKFVQPPDRSALQANRSPEFQSAVRS